MSVLKFRTDIQGLRAIAVGTVVLFHAWPDLLTGGYIGVDVFFVISGFLISSILLRDLDAGRFSLAEFYRRRVRRIFPALFVVLAASLVGGWVLLDPNGYKWLAKTAVAATFFASNIEFFQSLDYFSPTAETIPLLHTWSLAVEEQYYLFFPLILWALTRRTWGRQNLFWIMVGFAVLGVILSEWSVHAWPKAGYYLLPFRMFELLLGVIAAFAPRPTALPRLMREGGMAAGVITILACAVFYTSDTPFPGLWAVPPTAATAFVLYAGRDGDSWTARALSLPPMLFIGGISYSMYLWHWPLMAFARLDAPHQHVPVMSMLGIVAATVALAWLTYRFIEQPVMAWKTDQTGFLKLGGAGMACAAVLAGGIYGAGGVPQRFTETELHSFAAADAHSPRRYECHQTDANRRPYDQTCVLNGHEAADIVVWGDSHGTELAYILQDILGTTKAVRQVTSSACPPVVNPEVLSHRTCVTENMKILKALVADSQVTEVILAMNRTAYPKEQETDLALGYEAAVNDLVEAGKHVTLLEQIPNIEIAAPRRVGMVLKFGGDLDELGRPPEEVFAETASWDHFIRTLEARYPVKVIDPKPFLCDAALCPAVSDTGEVLYFNETHVSLVGARPLAEAVRAALIP